MVDALTRMGTQPFHRSVMVAKPPLTVSYPEGMLLLLVRSPGTRTKRW
jgi:hypothetical protein